MDQAHLSSTLKLRSWWLWQIYCRSSVTNVKSTDQHKIQKLSTQITSAYLVLLSNRLFSTVADPLVTTGRKGLSSYEGSRFRWLLQCVINTLIYFTYLITHVLLMFHHFFLYFLCRRSNIAHHFSRKRQTKSCQEEKLTDSHRISTGDHQVQMATNFNHHRPRISVRLSGHPCQAAHLN